MFTETELSGLWQTYIFSEHFNRDLILAQLKRSASYNDDD